MSIRLMNTTTFELKLFLTDPPPYVILSHLWGKDEIVFQDVKDGNFTKRLLDKDSEASRKIAGFCKYAAAQGYSYAWIDTCCIDKTSSSELQEAINSMFRWYRNAEKCFVYLSDVSMTKSMLEMSHEEILNSRWFTRGWTLQELLAPRHLDFYNRRWEFLATKRDLSGSISSLTGIPPEMLRSERRFRRASIAQRMSWAASRITTVPEDTAYCLMGLFDVNMPLLYGEGKLKAFQRLQYEILTDSDDESIFAWFGYGSGSMIAPSPDAFRLSRDIVSVRDPDSFDPDRPPYTITNKGLRIMPRLLQSRLQGRYFGPVGMTPEYDLNPEGADSSTILPLNCTTSPEGKTVAIKLKRSNGERTWYRSSEDLFVSNEQFGRKLKDQSLPSRTFPLGRRVRHRARGFQGDCLPRKVMYIKRNAENPSTLRWSRMAWLLRQVRI